MVPVLKALENNGDLVICSVKEPVMGLFRLTRMNRVFQFFATVEEGTNAFLQKQ
jgi:anti-sigma B factor antagonist